MKTIHFHIGVHKTASTTLQKTLAGYARALAEQDVYWFPLFHEAATRLSLAAPCTGTDFSALEPAFANFGRIPHDHVLVSCENLFGRAARYMENSSRIARDLRRLTKGFEVRIICHVRRQDTYLESTYRHVLKMGRPLDFKAYLYTLRSDSLDWRNILRGWETVFGEDHVTVLPYETILVSDALFLGEFLGLFNVRVEGEVRLPVYNPGISMRGVGHVLEREAVCDAGEREGHRRMMEAAYPNLDGRIDLFGARTEREMFLSQYEAGNRALFAAHGLDFERWWGRGGVYAEGRAPKVFDGYVYDDVDKAYKPADS